MAHLVPVADLRTPEEVRAHARAVHRRKQAYAPPVRIPPVRPPPPKPAVGPATAPAPSQESRILAYWCTPEGVQEVRASSPIFVIPEAPTATCIKKHIAAEFGLTIRDLDSDIRTATFVAARHVSFWTCRKLMRISWSQIGKAHGGRDHTTVLHGVRKVERLREGEAFARRLDTLCDQITASWQAWRLKGGAE